MIKIGLDMMGGDFAPLEAVKGVAAFFEENKGQFEDLAEKLITDQK